MKRAALLCLLLGFPATDAMAGETALGRDGELYRLRSLTAEQALGEVAASTADDPVLAVEVSRGDAELELLVVPGTEGPEMEASAHLAYEQNAGTLFVTWDRRSNGIHSQIFLASYDGESWSDPIPVSDQRFSLKSSPKIAITRESFDHPESSSDAPDQQPEVQRTTLHVVWFEERGSGPAIVYAPIVLLNGSYVGTHTRLTLSELFTSDGTSAELDADSLTPTIRATSDKKGVAVGFVDPRTSKLAITKVSPLSGELGAISESLRSHLLQVGSKHDSRTEEGLQRIADEARGHIIDIGARMDRPLLRWVADEARGHIIDIGAGYDSRNRGDLERLSDAARGHIIDIGFRLDSRGLPRSRESRSVTVDLRAGTGELLTVLRAEEVGARSMPESTKTDSDLYLSGSGDHALIAWLDGNQLRYRETTKSGWAEVRSLKLDRQLTIEAAKEILSTHLDNR